MTVLDALFDSDAFNRRVFFPRGDVSVCDGAADVFVDVDALSSSTLSSSDRAAARLHLRLHPCDGQQVRVLLFHGNGEVVADYDDAAAACADVGAGLAGLAVVDFRGYGQSTGIPSLRAIVDDAAAVVRAVVAHDGGRPIVVMGRSLGSLCAAEIAGTADAHVAAHVDGIIIESGIARLAGLIERRGLPVPAVISGSRYDPLPKVKRNRRPLLVLHGEDDEIIDVSEGQELFEAATAEHKMLRRVPGRGHNDISGARVYWKTLRQFIASIAEQRP